MHIQSCLSLHCCVSITMSSGVTYGDNWWTVNTLNVILLPDSAFCITPHRTMVLGLSKNVILSTPMKVFFKVFFLAARHPADFDGCPTTGAKALASVSLIPWHPCHSRPALHSRVPFLRCEHSISVSARHF